MCHQTIRWSTSTCLLVSRYNLWWLLLSSRVFDALFQRINRLNEFKFLMEVDNFKLLLFLLCLCLRFGKQTWCSITWAIWNLIYDVFRPRLRLALLLTVFLSYLVGDFIWIRWKFLRILHLFFANSVVIKILNFFVGDWNVLIFLIGLRGLLFIWIFGLRFWWSTISSKLRSSCQSNLIYLGKSNRFHLQLLQIAISGSRSLLTVSEVILSKNIALATAKEKSWFSIWIDCIQSARRSFGIIKIISFGHLQPYSCGILW